MEYDELACACALNRIFNYSPSKSILLLSRFPSASSVFELKKWELEELFGKESHFVADILDKRFLDLGQEDVKWAQLHGVQIYYYFDKTYPWRLKECCDAPLLFFFKGNCDLNHKRVISVVGTRRATDYGLRMCGELLKSMSELDIPPVVVSGLAYGVDIAAHMGAIELGMKTVGVMATGLDRIYPASHRKNGAIIVENGGLLTDFPINTPPLPLNFIRRNRIIAGLSDATILVESGRDGGGVITAKMAHSYHRDVFAYPGRLVDNLSAGCNTLIKDNIAEIIINGSTIKRSMGWKKSSKDIGLNAKLLTFESDNDVKRKIVSTLYEKMSATPDELIEYTGCHRGDISIALTELEMERRVESDFSGRFKLHLG